MTDTLKPLIQEQTPNHSIKQVIKRERDVLVTVNILTSPSTHHSLLTKPTPAMSYNYFQSITFITSLTS